MAEELTVDVANADFDEIKQFDEERREFWYARDLWKLLGYSSWQKFEPVIKKAVTACRTAGIPVGDHFNLSELLGVAYTQIRNPDSNLSLLGRS